ncbi:MAG TPA: asparagine synthase (glutamine-hydrolyzing) [Clostridia bacterium]|nr:asparagine synthase (glutamine-hydrolyzing) [Clostridia bacterium]
MCGIAGWIDFNSNLNFKGSVMTAMADALSKRGPDASGLWMSEHAAFSHRRLSVVDPVGGSQPMTMEYGGFKYIITYNGELYNTLDLKRELQLKGHKFMTTSDTEVLLVSYIEWGPFCIERFNGIFAFGIWDEKEQRLFLGRDRFGVKPLFYAIREGSLIFASELKALLIHPLIEPEVDSEGLAEILALGPARTPGNGVYKNVHEVKPAHCLTYGKDGLSINSYWGLQSHPHTDSPADTIEMVRYLVEDTIERQLVADVPICTFLSGGLDSSAITAIAANHFRKTGKGQLHTFSIDYADNSKYFISSSFQPDSDAPWVKLMSEHFDTIHHNITIDTPMLIEALTQATRARDLPGMADVDSSLLLFCHEIKKSHVVSLSGECADEVFGGYPWFYKEDALNSNTFPWSSSLDERTKVLNKDLINYINPAGYVQKRYEETLAEVPRLIREDFHEARRREMFYLNIYWFMANLLDRKDRMSMANGLEVRVPFCDHRLVQYVWNIPWSLKSMGGREKGILRKALEGILPQPIIERKKSPYPKTHNPDYEQGVSKWLKEIINDPGSPLLPIINKKAVKAMMEGKSDYGKPWFGQLMAAPQMYAYLIQIDIWLRENKVCII